MDATALAISSGGLRRYTEELHRHLVEGCPGDTVYLLSDHLTPPKGFLERRWWSIGLPLRLRKLRCDVFHGTNFAVPYLPLTASVMSVHDLSPWLEAAWHTEAGRVRRRTPALVRLGIATLILTGTEAVRRQVIDFFRIHPDRVAVTPYAGCLARTTPWSDRPYFVYAGTVEPRKNVPAVVDAWRTVRQRHDVDLVIAGRRRVDGPEIAEAPGLRVLGEVSDAVLAQLFSGAVALVYPSSYEGFGLPVVEAMQCGCAVITSRDPSLAEVSGGAAIHCDLPQLAAAMEMLLVIPGELERRRSLAYQRALDFSWRRTAALTREAYAEAIRRFA